VDLQRLRYFSVLAEELHFTRAAARLHLDQSALSASIRRLERDLGVRLFDRTSRRVELTAAGEALLPRARRLLGSAHSFSEAVREVRGGAVQGLRVGLCFGPFAAADLTSSVLTAFRARHPEIAMSLQPLDFADPWGIARTDLDVVLGREAAPEEEHVTPLFSEPRVVVVPRHDEVADAVAVRTTDLQHRAWVSTATGDWPEEAKRFLAHYDLRAQGFEVHREPMAALPFADLTGWQLQSGLLTASAGSNIRLCAPEAVTVPLLDVPRSVVTVVDRRFDARTRAFTAVAAEVCAALVDLVPEATADVGA
jgi:DNA-binding transcriptional LysR family regulator